MRQLPIHACIAALATMFALAGCATPTEVVKLHHDKSQPGAPYDKLLVVSLATDIEGRRRLEDLLSNDLTGAGTAAVPAYAIKGLTPSVLQQDIDDAAAEVSADAILITHIVSVDQEVEFEEGRTEVLFECRGGDPADYFLYDHKELKLPDDIKVAQTVVAITNLYGSIDGARIWTIQSTCFDMASMDEVLQEEAKAIVQQLRHDRLID
jgi:hypothetical protein